MSRTAQIAPAERWTRNDQPQVELESEDSHTQKRARHHQLERQRAHRTAHDGEQDVVRRDDDEHRRIERAIPVKTNRSREDGDARREYDADGIGTINPQEDL